MSDEWNTRAINVIDEARKLIVAMNADDLASSTTTREEVGELRASLHETVRYFDGWVADGNR